MYRQGGLGKEEGRKGGSKEGLKVGGTDDAVCRVQALMSCEQVITNDLMRAPQHSAWHSVRVGVWGTEVGQAATVKTHNRGHAHTLRIST